MRGGFVFCLSNRMEFQGSAKSSLDTGSYTIVDMTTSHTQVGIHTDIPVTKLC